MSSGERKEGKKRNGGENPTEGGESPVNTMRIEKGMLEKAYYRRSPSVRKDTLVGFKGDSREGR